MAGVELATAYVSLVVEGSKVQPGVKKALGGAEVEADQAGKRAGSRFTSKFGSALKVGATLGAAFAATKGIQFLGDAIEEAQEASVVTARTSNVIKKMGGASKVTAAQVADLAGAISNKVGIDDEAIQSGQNLILTFGNIRNEVGEGNAIFDRTSRLMVDMSAAMGTDMKSSAIQLGKALNDPLKGLTALSRVGVSFTEQQKDQIKTLVEQGDTLKAQKIILGEVERQFGGAAKAMATPAERAKVAWGNLKEQIGTELLPVVNRFSTWAADKGIPAMSRFVKQFQKGKGAAGEVRDALAAVKNVAEDAAPLVGNIVREFNDLPGWIKTVLVGGGAAAFTLKKTGLGSAAAGAAGIAKAVKVQKVFETNPAALAKGGPGSTVVPGGKKPKFGGAGFTVASIVASLGIGWLADGVGKQRPGGSVRAGTAGSGRGNIGSEAMRFDKLLGGKKFEMPGLKEIKAGVADVIALMAKIPPKVMTDISAPGALDTKREVIDLAKKYNLTPKQVETLMRAKDFATKDIKAVQKNLRETHKQKTIPEIKSDIREAVRKATDVRRLLGLVDRTKTNPKITISASQAQTELRALKARMDALRDKTVTINVRRVGGNAPQLNMAAGGTPDPGRVYRVGEHGPELFVANQRGRIVPNHQLEAMARRSGSSGPATFNIYDADGVLLGAMRGVAVETSDLMAAHDNRMGR